MNSKSTPTTFSSETQSAVRINRNSSQPFTTTKGFRQGDALSCDLFNICLEIAIRKANIKASNRNTKLAIYKTLILPVLTYKAESWTMSDAHIEMLGVFERKVLRMIYGPVCERNEWRIRFNHELYMYREPTV